MSLDRHKYLLRDQSERLLRAVRGRVRVSTGGSDPARRKAGLPHKNVKRDLALLAFAALTGSRECEVVSLRFSDLVAGFATSPLPAERPARVRVMRAKKRDPGTGGTVYEDIAVPETARRAVEEYVASVPAADRWPGGRLFAITTRQARNIFKFYARRAGIPPEVSMHALRHARGVQLYEDTRDLNVVREALGHASVTTTQIYMHAVDRDKKLAASDLSIDEEENDAKPDGDGDRGL